MCMILTYAIFTPLNVPICQHDICQHLLGECKIATDNLMPSNWSQILNGAFCLLSDCLPNATGFTSQADVTHRQNWIQSPFYFRLTM